jgi:peptidoglycan lytic transglycosylase F
MTVRLITYLLLTLGLASGCARQDSLDQITKRGELLVVSRNSPTTWHTDRTGETGFEYVLAGMFADELGVKLKMKPAFSLSEIFVTLLRSEADLAAAGLALTGERGDAFPHSVPYYQLRPQVVYVAGTYRPRSLKDLGDMEILVLSGSRHSQILQTLRDTGFPELRWREIEEVDSMELLEQVNAGKAPLAIIDSNEFEVQQSLYPRLKVAFDLGSSQDMVWFLPPDRNNARLQARMDEFLQKLQGEGTLEVLREKYFGHAQTVSRIGSHTFARKMRVTLPKYLELIKQVAAEYQMDWRMLAAIAYQESHWNPKAESPTGVRGMMMLTVPTAKETGVTNRLDAGQSLRGGARYFKNTKRRLPDDIYEPDRTYMALAAYNIGRGHLEDARVLTDRQGGDPHLWTDVLERLPLLQKSRYYETLKYGYARGQEAATYVQNIRHYYGILQWQDIASNQPLPPIRADDHLPQQLSGLSLRAL